MTALPLNVRSYEIFDKMKSKVLHFSKMNKIIMELKTDAMKERHWRSLLSKIKI